MGQTLKDQLAPYATTDFNNIWGYARTTVMTLNRYGGEHAWHTNLQRTYSLHPVIRKLVEEYSVKPLDWHLMLLEWPHVSETDESCITYTRNAENGQDFIRNGSKRQTKTSIGKYLARHYPFLPAHTLRDLAGTYTAAEYAIWDTKEKIISSIELGPQSCMKSTYGSIPFRDHDELLAYNAGNTEQRVRWDTHPYAVYAPEYGWAAAVMLDKGRPDIVVARALVHTQKKVFVRSYMRASEGSSYSETCDRLETWLREQGYRKESEWPYGLKLRKLEHPKKDGLLFPYIDGGTQKVSDQGDHFIIDDDGPYDCTNTDGTADGAELYGACEDCGEGIPEGDDEYLWAGRYEDRLVCGCCAESYVYVRGDRGHYHTHEDDVIRVGDDCYDAKDLPDYIIQCEDGEYRHKDDCVFCQTDEQYYDADHDDLVEIDGKWYRTDDDDVVECKDGEYRLKDDCWESAEGNWYPDDEDSVDVTGGTYHPDELREMADNA